MEETRNLCAQIPATLHAKVMEEKAGQTLSDYMIELLTKHFEGGKETMNENKTIAFQVSPELNQRLKAYLAKHNLKQAHFIIGLIEEAINKDEADEE